MGKLTGTSAVASLVGLLVFCSQSVGQAQLIGASTTTGGAPTVNDFGTVAFTNTAGDIVTRTSGGTFSTIASAQSGVFTSSLSISNNNFVSYYATTFDGQFVRTSNGILSTVIASSRPGGNLAGQTIVPGAGGSRNGAVSFLVNPTPFSPNQTLYRYGGGNLTSLGSAGRTQSGYYPSDPKSVETNTIGTTAFYAGLYPANTGLSLGIFTVDTTTANPVTIASTSTSTPSYSNFVNSGISLNSSSQVAFSAQRGLSETGLFLSNGLTTQTIISSQNGQGSATAVSLSDSGKVVFTRAVDSQIRLSYYDGVGVSDLFSTNSTLDGLIIQSFSLSSRAFDNSNGTFVVNITFTNSQTNTYLITPVPEPTAMLLIVAPAAIYVVWRRRRVA